MPSIGFMVQVMPADVISQVMPHIIIGIGIGIMPGIIDIMFGFICIAGVKVSSS